MHKLPPLVVAAHSRRGAVERVCRRLRRVALSLPCRVQLSADLGHQPGTAAESVLRCLRDRVPGDLEISAISYRSEGWALLGRLAAQLLPTVTRCVRQHVFSLSHLAAPWPSAERWRSLPA